MEELIKKLIGIEAFLVGLAKSYRKSEQELSYALFKDSESVAEAARLLKRNIPQEIEIEGGGTSWWFVCGECHGYIGKCDNYCRNCGRKIDWSGVLLGKGTKETGGLRDGYQEKNRADHPEGRNVSGGTDHAKQRIAVE